jgi:hypothetical protein
VLPLRRGADIMPFRTTRFVARCAGFFAAAGLATGLMPAHAAGTVEVRWVDPEHYHDAGDRGAEREHTLRALGSYLESLGQQLPDGQTLRLEVLDLDLAGELRPFGVQEVRVLRGRTDWPQMSLRYTLLSDGRALRSGQAHLADMDYLFGLRGLEAGHVELGYEKRMVRQWFDLTFAPH